MIKKPTLNIGLALLLLLFTNMLRSQCLTPPPLDSCNGTETSLIDNQTLNAGVKRWYYGPTATFNQLTMNGGTLVVCSDLTIDRFYMDSGTIIVRPGARFVVGGGLGTSLVLRGNSAVYNYGTFQIVRNLVLDWGGSAARPNIIMNVTRSSVFLNSNQYFVINNPWSFFVNNGRAEFHGIITDNGSVAGSVCLGNGSDTRMTVLYNRIKNSYVVPSGFACLNVTEFSQFYDTLTSSPTLNACLGNRHYSDSSCRPWGCRPNAWGNANLFRGCNSCVEIQNLSLKVSAFAISEQENANQLNWTINMSASTDISFIIERSGDGRSFYAIDSFAVSELSNRKEFTRTDLDPIAGFAYYRIRCINRVSGYKTSSSTIKTFQSQQTISHIYPNPFKKSITMNFKAGKKPIKLEFYNMQGILVYRQPVLFAEANKMQVNIPVTIPAGGYLLKIIYPNETEIKRLFKEE